MSSIKKDVLKTWWNIKDIAFVGTNITRKNGMFMSTANKVPVGSIYDIKKNVFGVMKDENLIFSQDSLSKKYNDYPPIKKDSTKPPAKFQVKEDDRLAIELITNLIKVINIEELGIDLGVMLNNTREVDVTIKQWGIDYLEEGMLMEFLNRKSLECDNFLQPLFSGNCHIATRGIWIKGITFYTEVEKQINSDLRSKIDMNKAIKKSEQSTIEVLSETKLKCNICYKHKFYPFFKFRKIDIEKKNNYVMIASADLPDNDVMLDDVDFSDYTV